MKKIVEKYFYQSIVVGLLIVAALVSALGYFVTNVFNIEPGYFGADRQVLLSYEDSTLTLDEGIFIAKDMQAYYEEYYLSNKSTINWDKSYKDGKTYEDVILDDTLLLLKQVFLFSEYAKANNIELTTKDLDSINADAKAYLNDNPDFVIDATGANMELLKKFYTRTAYYGKVCDEIYNKTDLTVDTEDVRQCLVAIITISPNDFDSPKETAEKIMERVGNGEVLTGVAEKYEAKISKTNIGPNSLEGNELEKFCLSLKDGQCQMLEQKGTYYIVYCYQSNDQDQTAAAKEQKKEELKDKAKMDFYNELLKKSSVKFDEDAWSFINFDTPIYTSGNIKESLLTK